MTTPTMEQKERLRKIAMREAGERKCPKCGRRNALRKNFNRATGNMDKQCSWSDCKHVVVPS